jgi:hypothetical protein
MYIFLIFCLKNFSYYNILINKVKFYLRPRKRFNYENPIFVMDQLLFNPEVAFMT